MAVEKTGTEKEVILFNFHSAEGQLGVTGQLAKGCLISVMASFLALIRRGKGLDEINKVIISFLNYFLFT